MHHEDHDDDDDIAPKKRSLLGHDLDVLVIFVKRAAAIGAVLGFLHHLRCFSGH